MFLRLMGKSHGVCQDAGSLTFTLTMLEYPEAVMLTLVLFRGLWRTFQNSKINEW
jgi:hypothetical protein